MPQDERHSLIPENVGQSSAQEIVETREDERRARRERDDEIENRRVESRARELKDAIVRAEAE
jgi:hypothetical protein